jgi:membrane protease YdiL (CAAX protease family)
MGSVVDEVGSARGTSEAGKAEAHTPVVLLERQRAVWGYVGLMAANYVAIVLEVRLEMIAQMALLAAITAPLIYRAVRRVMQFYSVEHTSMSNKTKGIISFLLLAFGIAWIAWEIPIRLGMFPHDPLFQLAALPGGFAPAIAAIVVRRWVTREGFADAGLRPNLRRWPYYLVAWLLPLAVTTCVVILAAALGLGQPDFTLKRALAVLAPGNAGPLPTIPSYLWAEIPILFLITALIATPILWGEEFGWRGYLQLRLLSQRPLLAAIATGVIWGMWHYPLNVRGYNFPDHPLLGLAVFPVSTTLISIVFGWLRLRTGSIWASSLAHAATNAVGGSLTMLLFAGGPNLIFVSYLGILSWIPLGILCAWIVLTGQLGPESAS